MKHVMLNSTRKVSNALLKAKNNLYIPNNIVQIHSLKPKKSKVKLNVLNENCVKSSAEINDEEQTGVLEYKTFLFSKPPEDLNLLLFTPEVMTFGCKIGYNLDNETGENSKLKVKGNGSKCDSVPYWNFQR